MLIFNKNTKSNIKRSESLKILPYIFKISFLINFWWSTKKNKGKNVVDHVCQKILSLSTHVDHHIPPTPPTLYPSPYIFSCHTSLLYLTPRTKSVFHKMCLTGSEE